MDICLLQEFVLTTEHKSIKKAASQLHLAPTTLRSRLNKLERSLNTRLFETVSGEFTLTQEGLNFYRDAVRITEEYQTLVSSLLAPEKYIFHHLRIAIPGGRIPFQLEAFLNLLTKKNPGFELELTDHTSSSVSEELLQNKTDLCFSFSMNLSLEKSMSTSEVSRYIFAPSRQYVLLPAAHPLASRERISLKDLDGECFILQPASAQSAVRDFQIANLLAAQIRYSLFETSSSPVFSSFFVSMGKGVYISPEPVSPEPPGTVSIPFTGLMYPAAPALFYLKNAVNPETLQFIKAFRQFIQEDTHYENRKTL